jgi:hypothetical protein
VSPSISTSPAAAENTDVVPETKIQTKRRVVPFRHQPDGTVPASGGLTLERSPGGQRRVLTPLPAPADKRGSAVGGSATVQPLPGVESLRKRKHTLYALSSTTSGRDQLQRLKKREIASGEWHKLLAGIRASSILGRSAAERQGKGCCPAAGQNVQHAKTKCTTCLARRGLENYAIVAGGISLAAIFWVAASLVLVGGDEHGRPYLSGSGEPLLGTRPSSLWRAAWVVWTFVADPGTHADAGLLVPRLIGVAASLMGVLLTTLFIAAVLGTISRRVLMSRAGRGALNLWDHFVIIGQGPKAVGIIKQLVLSQTKGNGCTIVLLQNHASLENVEVEARILRGVGEIGHNLVYGRLHTYCPPPPPLEPQPIARCTNNPIYR